MKKGEKEERKERDILADACGFACAVRREEREREALSRRRRSRAMQTI